MLRMMNLEKLSLQTGKSAAVRSWKLTGENALVQLFEASTGINLSDSKVRFTGRSMELGVSEDMLSRVFDGLGRPIDGGPEILPEKRVDVNGLPMNPAARNYPRSLSKRNLRYRWVKYLSTGTKASHLFRQRSSPCPACGADRETGEGIREQ